MITAVASLATTIGVFLTGWQVRLAKKQSVAQFEDSLDREYRDIIRRIPATALLGHLLTEAEQAIAKDAFYHYVDLTNEQIFLRQQKRICTTTWMNWQSGIKSNMLRPAFQIAWENIKANAPDTFKELRRLEASNFHDDPIRWRPAESRSYAKFSKHSNVQFEPTGNEVLVLKKGNHDVNT